MVPSSEETSFLPPSMVYICTHITLYIQAGSSVLVAIHVLHSGHFLSWDMGTPHNGSTNRSIRINLSQAGLEPGTFGAVQLELERTP